MAKEVAYVQLKLSTSQFILLKTELEERVDYHQNQLGIVEIPAHERAMHRATAGQLEDLLMQMQ